MAHGRLGSEILSDELSKDTVALSMKDADALHTHEHGIIDEIAYCLKRLVTTHATHVKVGMERLTMIVDGALRHLRHVVSLQSFLDGIQLTLRLSRGTVSLLLQTDRL